MNPFRYLDGDAWPRAGTYAFFQTFANPCFNISTTIPAEPLHRFAKARGESFFLLSLYAILRAANAVPAVRQRVWDGRPVEFERIAAMTPVMTEHELFRQAWCDYAPDFDAFADAARPRIEEARRAAPAPRPASTTTSTAGEREDFICASCAPWLHFTSVTAADHHFDQAVPILTWGKMKNGDIPLAVKFSHAFLDGLHVGRFFDAIEHGFAHPESLYAPPPA